MKHVLAQLKQYKKDTFLTIGFTILEVILEVLLPFITAKIIDDGLQQSNMSVILRLGIIMIVFAAVSLFSGAMAGKFAASASSGLAANLREALYIRVQGFSFSNIDKFSTAGLVTRMTTDVTNLWSISVRERCESSVMNYLKIWNRFQSNILIPMHMEISCLSIRMILIR